MAARAQYSDHFASANLKLQKKSSFLEGVSDLHALIVLVHSTHSLVANLEDIKKAIARVFTLLKSRFTSASFWKAGKKLALSAQSLLDNPQLSQQLDAWVQQCDEVLAQENDPEEEATPQPFLFEGQLTSAEGPPRQQPGGDSIEALMEQLTSSEAQQGAGAGDFESREEVGARLVAALSEAGLLDESAAPKRAPPAAESAVNALRRETLTERRIMELGGSTQSKCSVCQEDLQVDESVQIMPCSSSHVFHVPCLAPWLKENNSCPVCRHELRTDDEQYELEKGARNAQSHNDFCYI